MNIYLINHPQVYNPNNVCFGQSELPLAENFSNDFTWISDHLSPLKDKGDVRYFCSPLRRCSKPANFLSDGNYETDKRLADQHFGNWELKEWDEINTTQLQKWYDDFVNFKIPKGESLADVFLRTNQLYQELLLLKEENLILVTHTAVIKCILCNVMGLSLQNIVDFEISNSSISKIVFDRETYTDKVSFINRSISND